MTSITLDELAHMITSRLELGYKLYDLKSAIHSCDIIDWQQFVNENCCCYNRNLVFRNNTIDIYIMTWKTKQKSKIHDHPEFGCLVKILQGELTERIYVNKNDTFINTKTNKLKVGEIGHQIGKNGIHQIINDSCETTVSLHVYSPPKYSPFCYELENMSCSILS